MAAHGNRALAHLLAELGPLDGLVDRVLADLAPADEALEELLRELRRSRR